jgi:hypothetical protein
MEICKHDFCKELFENGANKKRSVIVCPLKKSYGETLFIAGLEKGGKSKGKYNLMCETGKGKKCYIETAIRGLREEFKININEEEFNEIFMKDGKYKCLLMRGCPIFYGYFKNLRLKELNNKIKEHECQNISEDYKEIKNLKYFDLNCRMRSSTGANFYKNERYIDYKISKITYIIIKKHISNIINETEKKITQNSKMIKHKNKDILNNKIYLEENILKSFRHFQ